MNAPHRRTSTEPIARKTLQAATHEYHERIHRLDLLRRLAAGTITRNEYVALLKKFLTFHGVVEQQLFDGPSLISFGINLPERVRSPSLRADLSALGVSFGVFGPTSFALPLSPESPAAALGMLYVTEGATLGGQVLARALDHLLGRSQDGRRFLLGHGPRHATLWREMCSALEVAGGGPEDRMAMAASAVDTFAFFEAVIRSTIDETAS